MLQKFLILNLILNLSSSVFAQRMVSISIDDVPNSYTYQVFGYKSSLLYTLDKLQIPVSIFINEGLIYKTDSVCKNFEVPNEWAKRDFVTLGNHTFNHTTYSDVGFENFKIDIEKGECMSREMTNKYHKSLKYFRPPYNDLENNAE